jgi:hypothetical protein
MFHIIPLPFEPVSQVIFVSFQNDIFSHYDTVVLLRDVGLKINEFYHKTIDLPITKIYTPFPLVVERFLSTY